MRNMDKDQINKHVMDGYVGVKFEAVQCANELSKHASDFYSSFKETCERLKAHDMTVANAGNMSIKCEDGFLITSSGSNLGCLEENELVFIEKCDVENEKVY